MRRNAGDMDDGEAGGDSEPAGQHRSTPPRRRNSRAAGGIPAEAVAPGRDNARPDPAVPAFAGPSSDSAVHDFGGRITGVPVKADDPSTGPTRHAGINPASMNAGHRERLRERMFHGGADAFHDHELLEYVLTLVTPRRDTKPLAKRLIAEFGSYAAVIAADPRALAARRLSPTTVAALKFVQASALRLLRAETTRRPVLSSWQALIDYCHADMAHGLTERFRVLYLNSRNMLVLDEVFSEGTVNQAPVYVREVVKRALDIGATALILVHNHPSGDPAPSREDIALTKDIIEAGRKLSLVVHDHIIIGRGGHVSLKSLGLI